MAVDHHYCAVCLRNSNDSLVDFLSESGRIEELDVIFLGFEIVFVYFSSCSCLLLVFSLMDQPRIFFLRFSCMLAFLLNLEKILLRHDSSTIEEITCQCSFSGLPRAKESYAEVRFSLLFHIKQSKNNNTLCNALGFIVIHRQKSKESARTIT